MVREWEPGRGAADDRLELIRRSAAYKARIVAADPHEEGVRAALNLGHTIGHAIEVATGYQASRTARPCRRPLPALWLSARTQGLDPAVEDEVRELLAPHGLPTRARDVSAETVLEAMTRDKKARRGRIRFSLLAAVGEPVSGATADRLVRQAVDRALSE